MVPMPVYPLLRASLLIASLGLLSACDLPSGQDRNPSLALAPHEGAATLLGRGLAPLVAQHPGLSGVVSLPGSLDAFAARMVLISAAQRSIDIQYYIWRDDITGNLLLKALHDAARRDVRVRLLIDDNGTSGLDGKLALLNAEPNAEVRLFNPFPFRTFKQLGFLVDFNRLNRRMHNKSLTVDGQVTIVGGRNIGDEYFGATQGVAFTDLDVMVAGRLEYDWVPVRMVSDDPAKVLGRAQPETLLITRLMDVLGPPERSVDLISPYFVPTRQGVDAFGAQARQGVRVRVLTNAMESTDVMAVHAGYMKYRRPLLERGIELFEMRRQAAADAPREKAGPFGSSGSSLHAKTFAVDGERVFVGSFNFDPRSARLNTELGFAIKSAPMAAAISGVFEKEVPIRAYRLELNEENDLIWLDEGPNGATVLDTEPSSSFWKRMYIGFLSLLPIEPLL